jgi:putative flippase GtrA
MKQVLFVRLALFFTIVLASFVTCLALDGLLASHTCHDRRLWEGGAVALVCSVGFVLESFVLRHVVKRRNFGREL